LFGRGDLFIIKISKTSIISRRIFGDEGVPVKPTEPVKTGRENIQASGHDAYIIFKTASFVKSHDREPPV